MNRDNNITDKLRKVAAKLKDNAKNNDHGPVARTLHELAELVSELSAEVDRIGIVAARAADPQGHDRDRW